jgi:hypothetical protein
MPSQADISNMALSHLGHSKTIVALTERSQEARSCNLWYEQVRDEVLREFPWPFALVTESLALIAEEPNDDWGYSYTAPVNALRLVRSPYGSVRNPTWESETRYTIADGVLYSDQDLATIRYVERVDDPSRFPPDFVAALSYLLAARIAPSLTSKDQREGLVVLMEEKFKEKINKAKANALNEQVRDVAPESSLITARD